MKVRLSHAELTRLAQLTDTFEDRLLHWRLRTALRSDTRLAHGRELARERQAARRALARPNRKGV